MFFYSFLCVFIVIANGGSASGILPAVAIAKRPDLFGAAVIDFPFLDMLRYHEFTTFKGWIGGYGTSEDPDDFRVLRSYSPLHNLVKGFFGNIIRTCTGIEKLFQFFITLSKSNAIINANDRVGKLIAVKSCLNQMG